VKELEYQLSQTVQCLPPMLLDFKGDGSAQDWNIGRLSTKLSGATANLHRTFLYEIIHFPRTVDEQTSGHVTKCLSSCADFVQAVFVRRTRISPQAFLITQASFMYLAMMLCARMVPHLQAYIPDNVDQAIALGIEMWTEFSNVNEFLAEQANVLLTLHNQVETSMGLIDTPSSISLG